VRIERFRVMRSSPIAGSVLVLRHRDGVQAFCCMPMRRDVRLGGALGSCEFCTGLIQTDCLEIEFEFGFDAGFWFDFWAWVKVN